MAACGHCRRTSAESYNKLIIFLSSTLTWRRAYPSLTSIPHQRRGYFLFWCEFGGSLHKHVFSQQALCCFRVTADPRWSGSGSWSRKKNRITYKALQCLLVPFGSKEKRNWRDTKVKWHWFRNRVFLQAWCGSQCTWKSSGLLDEGRCFLALHWAFWPGWAGDGIPPISVVSSSPSAPPAQAQKHIFFTLQQGICAWSASGKRVLR